jgi:uncharacterized SAM-binding protein YcdF (DUF218 family)
MKRLRLIYYLILIVGLIATLWLGGLCMFVAAIESLNDPTTIADLEPTDGIVALTGGSERVTAALELLQAHKAKKLLISGVHPGLTLDRLLGNQPVPQSLQKCCIVLGHAAGTTIGNAEETQIWMNLENYQSLRLVTANYHMPRSLMIFHAAMPEITIVPYPVAPEKVKLDGWWRHPGTASLLVTEYYKYLVAIIRLKLDMI